MSWQQSVPIPRMLWNDQNARTWAEQVTSDPIIKTVTTTYAAESTDSTVLGDATAAGFTITLPDATTCKGAILKFMKSDAGANAVVCDGKGAQTIGGAANVTLVTQFDAFVTQSDGSNWIVWSFVWNP